jgi:hypothetical protein
MTICKESVDAYQKLLTNPSEYGLPFPPITEVLVPGEKVIAKHILYQQFMEWFDRDLPKVFFYIVMDNVFGCAREKDDAGNLGYRLQMSTKLE